MSEIESVGRHAAAGREVSAAVLSRLVVGYDGSPASDAAARFALALALRTDATVTLLHAGPTPWAGAADRRLSEAAEQVVAYEREWYARLCAFEEEGPVTARIERGNPAGALIAAALETAADLVLIGSRGAGRVRGALMGSVSSQLLSHAPCSVMVFRDATPTPGLPRAVVVGVDGSPSALHAVAIGQVLAAAMGARLVLVHAYDARVTFGSHPSQAMADLARRHGREVLSEARGVAHAPFDTELVQGDASTVLTEACVKLGPAVLVVGSRGLGGFKELLLGSTARWLAGSAPCPVVVARAASAEKPVEGGQDVERDRL